MVGKLWKAEKSRWSIFHRPIMQPYYVFRTVWLISYGSCGMGWMIWPISPCPYHRFHIWLYKWVQFYLFDEINGQKKDGLSVQCLSEFLNDLPNFSFWVCLLLTFLIHGKHCECREYYSDLPFVISSLAVFRNGLEFI